MGLSGGFDAKGFSSNKGLLDGGKFDGIDGLSGKGQGLVDMKGKFGMGGNFDGIRGISGKGFDRKGFNMNSYGGSFDSKGYGGYGGFDNKGFQYVDGGDW